MVWPSLFLPRTEAVCARQAALAGQLPWDGARLNFLAPFLLALFKVRRVNLTELATGFGGKAQSASRYQRRPRVFRAFEIDYEVLARVLVPRFPAGKGPWYLTLDRTNGKFGKREINCLILGIAHQGMALPVMWTVLGKAGNSDTQERIALLHRFVAPFGRTPIKALLADREFVGQDWFGWLQAQGIPFHIRLKRHSFIPHSWNVPIRAEVLFSSLTPGQSRYLEGGRPVWGCFVHLSALRRADGELLIRAGVGVPPQEAFTAYARRWEIETLFGVLKAGGFNFEDSHLTHPDRLGKLLALLALALAWSYRTGEARAERPPISLKKLSRAPSTPSFAMASISSALSSSTWPTTGLISWAY